MLMKMVDDSQRYKLKKNEPCTVVNKFSLVVIVAEMSDASNDVNQCIGQGVGNDSEDLGQRC